MQTRHMLAGDYAGCAAQQGGAHAPRDVVQELLEDLTLTNPKTASARAVLGLKVQVCRLRSIWSASHACKRQGDDVTPILACVQDKSILLDNPAAPVKAQHNKQSGLAGRLLSGAKRKQLGLEQLRPEEME
jgi:hypothetical protein